MKGVFSVEKTLRGHETSEKGNLLFGLTKGMLWGRRLNIIQT